jgi:hypothetical protein
VFADPGFSGLGFGTGGVTDRYGQDSLAAFVEHFNLLMEAGSRSTECRLTQKLSGAIDGVAAYSPQITKLFTLVVGEQPLAISQVEKIACHRSSPRGSIIEENAFPNDRFLGLSSYADGAQN